jgi:hypothetical protein
MDYSTFYKRLAYGYTVAEALLIPYQMPRWMFAIEQEEGMPIIDVVKREKSLGVSDGRLAESFEINKHTLGHWLRKWRRAGQL